MKQDQKGNNLFLLFRIGAEILQFNRTSESKLGVSLVQWCLLRALMDSPGTSAFSLSQVVGVHPSTLTQSLKRLSRKGYVFVGVDPRDSRRKVVSITRAGKEIADAAGAMILGWSQDLVRLENEMNRIHSFLQNQNGELA